MSKRPQHRSTVVDRRRVVATLVAAVVLVVVGVALAVGLSSHSAPAASGTSGHPAVASDRCPLTDVKPPSGSVPHRPAVAVKIGNEPEGARPQSGLNEADIVYDTPAEGFIMRYMAVYQCNSAAEIGPTRSVRWVDWHLLANYTGKPILAFAGGIDPDVTAVSSLHWLRPADLLGAAAAAGHRTTNRVPPDNLYTSTSALLGLFPHGGGPPKPVFDYSTAPLAGGKAVSKVAINFSTGTDVLWTWDPGAGVFLHSYAGTGPDIDALTGKQVSTTNVVVMVVHYRYGPYPESPGSTGDVESKVVGTGTGWVIRGGKEIAVAWHRAGPGDATSFSDHKGQAVTLAPGRTWVELVLDSTAKTGAVTFTP